MNRAACEREMIWHPFNSAAERKLTKLHRRKLRYALNHVKDEGREELESEYLKKLLEVRKRITRSRSVRVDSLRAIIEVLQVQSMWMRMNKGGDRCQMQNIPLDIRTDIIRGGCYEYLEPLTPNDALFVFEPLDIIPEPECWRLKLCKACHSHMLHSADFIWKGFVKYYQFLGRKIEHMLPVYVDYKRTVAGGRFSPRIQNDLMTMKLDVIEELSEDEDDGETTEAYEGQINPYCDISSSTEDWDIPSAQSEDVDYDLLLRQMR